MYVRYPYENKFKDLDDGLNLEEANSDFFIANRQIPRPPINFPDFNPNQPPINNPSQNSGQPSTPPPNFTPQKSNFKSGPQTKAVSPNSIRPCTFQFVYIWPRNGNGFWAWLIGVDRNSAFGFRWNGRRWVYFGIGLNRIDYFECFGRSSEENIYTDNSLKDELVLKPLDLDCYDFSRESNKKNYDQPVGSPPNFTPKKANLNEKQNKTVSSNSLRPCLYEYVYLWLYNGNSFWAWLTRIDKKTASGYRWKNGRWVYFGIDLNRIAYFECFHRETKNNAKTNMTYVESINQISDFIYDKKIAPNSFSIIYPFFKGLSSKSAEDSINNLIVDKYMSLIRRELFVEKKVVYMDIYGSYSLSLQVENIASFIFYLYSYGFNNEESISYASLTVNYETGNLVGLKDLFNLKSNYIEKLNSLSIAFLQKQNPEKAKLFKGITENQEFFLTPNSLVLYNRNETNDSTPDYLSVDFIFIPYSDITDLLTEKGPIKKIMDSNK
ncbi:hypothetical protein [Clostridium senegalense]